MSSTWYYSKQVFFLPKLHLARQPSLNVSRHHHRHHHHKSEKLQERRRPGLATLNEKDQVHSDSSELIKDQSDSASMDPKDAEEMTCE